jgi:hypothetical protein
MTANRMTSYSFNICFFVCVMQLSRFVLSIVDSGFSSCLMSVGIVPLFFLNMQKMNRVKGNCGVHPDIIYNYLHYSILKTNCLLLHCDHLALHFV